MSKGTLLRVGLAVAIVLLGSASPAWCTSAGPSIVVSPDRTPPAGTYDYALAVPEANGFTFNVGDEVFFSGMSGVTSATAANTELGFAFGQDASFTSTTATFVVAFPVSACPPGNTNPLCLSDTFPNDQGAPYDDFIIDPPAGTVLGTINWAIIQNGVTTYSGTVQGPVASTLEPSSLLLLGTGLLALVGAAKLKLLVS